MSADFSRRRSVRQLRFPPVDRDDPHREFERSSIERLGELGDSYEIVAWPLVLDRPAAAAAREPLDRAAARAIHLDALKRDSTLLLLHAARAHQ